MTKVLFLSLVLLLAAPLMSEAATEQQIKAKGDVIIAGVLAKLATFQGNYLAANGRYWQGIFVLPRVPVNGEELPPDLTKKAGGHKDSWADRGFSFVGDLPVNVAVNEYTSAKVPGYFVECTFRFDGKVWSKTRNVGPETSFEREWHVTPPAP